MTSYLKDKLGKTKISTEFVEGILHLSKGASSPTQNISPEFLTEPMKCALQRTRRLSVLIIFTKLWRYIYL